MSIDPLINETSSFSSASVVSTSNTESAKDHVDNLKEILEQCTVLFIVIVFTIFVITAMVTITVYNVMKRSKELLDVRTNNQVIEVEEPSIIYENSEGTTGLASVKVEHQSNTQSSNPLVEYKLSEDKTSWEFPRKNLRFERIIGEGAYGVVYKAEAFGIMADNVMTSVAVKMLKSCHTDVDMINLVIEMEVMKTIGKHENILNLYGCCTQGGPLYVITEYASLGNLRDLLINRNRFISSEERNDTDFFILSEKNLVSFALQIAKGMEYLASKKYVHRDLAARNILVTQDYVMKIGDFGLARDIRRGNYYNRTTDGTMLPMKWMAPEAIHFNRFTIKGDVWSFGIVLWEIMTSGDTPYRLLPNDERLFEIHRSGYRLKKPLNCSESIYAVMQSCWSYQLEDRPNFSDLVKTLSEILAETNEERTVDTWSPSTETPPSSVESFK